MKEGCPEILRIQFLLKKEKEKRKFIPDMLCTVLLFIL